MEDPQPTVVTRMLRAAGAGDRNASDQLVALVYDQLRAIAARKMATERRDHTLGPTALVSEAYLKLVGDPNLRWNDRTHFFNAAAQAMRRILVDHARSKGASRRAIEAKRALSSVTEAAFAENLDGILALDHALERLETVDASAAQIVRLRFFSGLSIEDTAEAMGLSARTVHREWVFARAWLLDALEDESPAERNSAQNEKGAP